MTWNKWGARAISGFALAELAMGLRGQGRTADSPLLVLNFVACIFLAACFTRLLLGRPRLLPYWLVTAWLVIGGVRMGAAILDAHPGWTLQQTISSGGITVTSAAATRQLDFRPRGAPAHLVNEFPLQAGPETLQMEQQLPVTLEASAFVKGTGALSIASTAPLRVLLGDRALFDSSLPPDTAAGMVPTPNGPRSLDDIRAGLQIAGYGGPWDDASVVLAYVRTTLGGGWRVDIDSPSEQRLSIQVGAQPVSTAGLTVKHTGLSLASRPLAGPLELLGRGLAELQFPVEAATGLLALCGAAWLGAGLARRGAGARLAIGAAAAVMYAGPYVIDWASEHTSLVFMLPGDDWRTYEGYARDIREHSILMLQGAALGHAVPLYFQPLYPYWLALLHTIAGEPVQSAVLAQQAAVACAIVLIAMNLPNHGAYLLAFLLVCATGILGEWFRLATFLLSENLLLLVFAGLLTCIARLERKPSYTLLVAIGALLGAGVLARTTTWLAVPVVLWIVCRSGKAVTTARLGAFVAVPLLLVVALVPLRNQIAAGSANPVPTSTTPFLYVALVPGAHYDTAPSSAEAGIKGAVRAILDQPGAVARQRLLNLAYVLGFPRALGRDDVPLVFSPLLLLWLLAPLGLLWRPQSKAALAGLGLALAHCMALVLIWPNSYYYRMVMPATLPLFVWDVFAIGQVCAGLPEPSRLGSLLKRLWAAAGPAC